MVGSMRDTTGELAAGIRNTLIKEASLRLAEAPDLNGALGGVLEVLCRHFGHEVGEIWMPDSAGKKLLLQGRFATDDRLGSISDTKHTTNFGMGEGLPGRAFTLGEAVIWNNLSDRPDFLRKELAAALGIVHGLAVPVGYADARPMAIVVLLARRFPEDAAGVKSLISEVGQGLAPEMARRKSEQELTNFFTLTQDLLMTVDSEGLVRKVNPALSTVLGFPPEEILGKHFLALIHPDDVDAALDAMTTIRQGQSMPYFEDRLRDAEGNYLWYVWTTSQPDAEGLVYCVGKNIDARKGQELRMRELTAELVTFQESITDALYIVDRDWMITYVNSEAEVLLKHKREDLLGQVLWEVFPEARETTVLPMYNLAMEKGEAAHFEVFYPPLNSWYQIHAYPSKSGLSVFFRDITMTRTLQELQDLERKALTDSMDGRRSLESITDELLKGIDRMLPGIRCSLLVVDSGERTLHHLSSPGLPDPFTSLLGSIPILEGHGSCGTAAARRHEVLSPDIANDPLWEPYCDLALAHGLQACWSYPVFATNGRLLATFANYFEVPRSPGPVERMVAERTSRTVAAMLSSRVADEAERLGNERYQLVSRATNDATWDLDIRTGHWVWGEGFRNRFGHDPGTEPATIASWQDHLHPDDSGRVMHGVRKVLRSPHLSSWEDEYRFIRADGSVAHVLDRGFVIRDDKGVAVRMVGAMQDISDRKEKEMMLRELNGQLIARALELQVSNTELERFAFVASHDLQEPLRMVASFMQLLEKRLHGQLDEKSQEFLRFAVDGAQRMKHLILDLLEYSRLGSRSLSIGEVDMTRMVTQVQNILMEQIRRTGARVEVGTLPIIQADPTRMIQLLQSLVDNALRYRSEAHPLITITSEEKGDHWHFSVCDNGIGMEEAYFEKVFVIFQRLDPDRENRSTGIGLTIARKIVEMHGGKIWIDSIPQKGSTFHFTIAKHMGPASAGIATRSHVPYTDLE
jgi:PAS domain S-box-containing protein